ncbi:MAG: hypothetical protein NTW86_22640 [Candidatus Sumerlaeota bacterium]|nr:hypothetical protein [Candidatus Sumerlaeota bacterium]
MATKITVAQALSQLFAMQAKTDERMEKLMAAFIATQPAPVEDDVMGMFRAQTAQADPRWKGAVCRACGKGLNVPVHSGCPNLSKSKRLFNEVTGEPVTPAERPTAEEFFALRNRR